MSFELVAPSPHPQDSPRRLPWSATIKASAVAVLSAALIFSGVTSAAAVEAPVVVSTHTLPIAGVQLLLKAPGTNKVYSAPSGGNGVGVLDTTTNATSTITIAGASHLEFDFASTGRLYVTSLNGIDVIDTATDIAVGYFPAPGGVSYSSLAIDPATGDLYVATTTGVSILDPADGSLTGSLSAAPGLSQLSINAATGVLYAVNSADVVAYDLATGAVTATSTVGNVRGVGSPHGVAVDTGNNRVIAISQTGVNPDSISIFDGTTLALINTFPVGANVRQLGYMPLSDLTVVTFGGPIPPALIDTNDGTVTPVSVVTGLNRGLFVDQENEFVYVSGTTNRVLTILAVPPSIVTTSLPNTIVGTAYSETVEVQGSRPMALAVLDGSLPPGLTLNPSTGVISGTATTAGVFTFTVTATNDSGAASQQYTIEVLAPPIITTTSLPDGAINTPYSSSVEATGSGPITFAISQGTLPPGLSLDPSTGAIIGTPTAPGVHAFTVTASNSVGQDTHDYIITVPDPASPPQPGGETPGTPSGEAPSPASHLASTGVDAEAVGIVAGAGLLAMLAGVALLLLRRPAR